MERFYTHMHTQTRIHRHSPVVPVSFIFACWCYGCYVSDAHSTRNHFNLFLLLLFAFVGNTHTFSFLLSKCHQLLWKDKVRFPKLFTSIKFTIHIAVCCKVTYTIYHTENAMNFHGLTKQMQICCGLLTCKIQKFRTQHRHSVNYTTGIETAECAIDYAIEMTRDWHMLTHTHTFWWWWFGFVWLYVGMSVCHSLFRFHLNRFLIELSWPISLNT